MYLKSGKNAKTLSQTDKKLLTNRLWPRNCLLCNMLICFKVNMGPRTHRNLYFLTKISKCYIPMINSCHDQNPEKICGNVDCVTLNDTCVICSRVYFTVQ